MGMHIFSRRICIAMISISVTNDTSQISFLILMVTYLSLHIQCQQFLIQVGNTMEWILLICFVVIVSFDLATKVHDTFKEYFIGNVFINYVLHAFDTDITSRFRKKLIQCVHNESKQCEY